ncbi:MAG: terminase small subunit [Rhodomicrobium sp.]
MSRSAKQQKPAPAVPVKTVPTVRNAAITLEPEKAAKLTPKQAKFCELYIETGSAAQAYRGAYNCEKMKPESVHRLAHELLKDVKIASRIEEFQARHAKRHDITVDKLTEELLPIAFADAGDFYEWGPDGVKVKDSSTLSRTQRACISEVSQTVTKDGGTIRVKLHDKLIAIEKLARLHGLIVERRDVSGEISISLAERVAAGRARIEARKLPIIEVTDES